MAGNKGKAARVVLVATGVALVGGSAGVAAMASRHVPLVTPGTTLGTMDLSGLTHEEVQGKVQEWWKDVANRPIRFRVEGIDETPPSLTIADAGFQVDLDGTLKKIPFDDFWSETSRNISGGKSAPHVVQPELTDPKEDALRPLAEFVKENSANQSPAKADFVNGVIVRTPERVGMELDTDATFQKLKVAGLENNEIEVAVKKGTPRVSDADLAKITDVVSEYTTRYSEGNANRAHNIKNAAQRLTGMILLPGETFSFNKMLGQRTAKNGFKLAGVYNNGKHDFDIGGGICQVSSTLYNSVLLANLKVKTRSNHTFPVPYVPVGRDATVSFPAPDFSFVNNYDAPIALSVRAGGGSITFRILGVKDPELKVAIESAGHSSWSRGEKVINDPSLPPGRRVVEEKGGSGHKITTYRVVYKGGEVVERQSLGVSLYNGGPRIVRVNPKAASTGPTEEVHKPVDDESPDAPPPATTGEGTGDGGG